MIQPDTRELEMMIGIAINTAPKYAIRQLVLPSRAIDRDMATRTLTDRVLKALGSYQITREADEHEEALSPLPLFPEDDFHLHNWRE